MQALLNLPSYAYQLKKEAEKLYIYDSLRKKYVHLTPEEWVRQHFIHFLITTHNYPQGLIKVEGGLHYNKLLKRSDIVIFDREGSVFMLVECKAPQIALSQDTFDQAATYNKVLKAPYITITNGMAFHCCKIDQENKKIIFLENLPIFV